MLALPPSSGPVLGFGVDTFAFRNDSRIHHRGKPDIYCNRCFLMARAVGQFRRFARFAPDEPRLSAEEYAARVWRVIRRGAWRAPLPAARRVVIPGYPSLHAFTGAEEVAVKAGLRGRLWTLVHPTNWRMTFPSLSGQQERVARETVAELRAERPVQLFLTDFPRIEINHSVLAFDYRANGPETVDFVVYDPNDPSTPGIVRFDRRDGRFHPAPLCGVAVSRFRAFRQILLAALLAGGSEPAHGPGPWSRQAVPSRRATSGSRSHESTVVHTPSPRSRPETSPVE